jgi:putative transposase
MRLAPAWPYAAHLKGKVERWHLTLIEGVLAGLPHASVPNEGLDGQTPLERWREDATPLKLVPDDELRWTLLTAPKPQTVRTSGVRHHRLDFTAPEPNGLAGASVEVRHRPHDDTGIEGFKDGVHLCTARPQNTLSPEERAALLAQRRADWVPEQSAVHREVNAGDRQRSDGRTN